MIENLLGITNTVEVNNVKETEKDALGLDNFLKMLLAQLKNQDPLSPMEGADFSAQLAQFSSLEQLFNVNGNLEYIKTDLEGGNQFQALDFIGKEITAEGGMLSLAQGKTASGSLNLDRTAECAVLITDPEGFPVRKISLGVLKAGQHSFEWDGRGTAGDMLEPGNYGFDITAMDQHGQFVPVETQIMGRVNRVSLVGDAPVLYVDDIPINMSQVVDIKVPEPEADLSDGAGSP